MKRIAVGLVFAILLVRPGVAEDRRSDTDHLVIVTFNAEFLWDGQAPEEGQVSFPWKNNPTKAEEHMRRVANVIRSLDADMVVLEEVEGQDALNTLNTKFLAGERYGAFVSNGSDTFTGQDIGLLTRIDPIGNSVQRDSRKGTSGSTEKSVSKNLVAKFNLGTTKVALVGVHLLARPDDESRKVDRQAQADAISKIAQDLVSGGFKVVVLGDFNDFDGAGCCADHVDHMPISTVLSQVKTLNPSDNADDLVSAASFIPKPFRFTNFFDRDDGGDLDFPGEFSSIDHILLDPQLASSVEYALIAHGHDPRAVTDHFPVLVRLGMQSTQTICTNLKIAALLPNPVGGSSIERQEERVTVRNDCPHAVSLDGWTLRDESGGTWSLSGSIDAGSQRAFLRNGQTMSLNNGGDTIELVSPQDAAVDSITYAGSVEGEEIIPTP